MIFSLGRIVVSCSVTSDAYSQYVSQIRGFLIAARNLPWTRAGEEVQTLGVEAKVEIG